MATKDTRIQYPPVHVFPRNPEIAQWVKPQKVTEVYNEQADTLESRTGQPLSSRVKSLDFVIGVGGFRNVIQVSSPPYIDYTGYDFNTNTWNEKPIKMTIAGNDDVEDLTNYFRRDVVTFSKQADGINDRIEYYFDGEKLVTNFDFSNPEDRKKITVRYTKLVDSIRVKAVLMSNSTRMVLSTPTVDQYTLVLGKQKVLN